MRVLVTRPAADARRTARRLEALGHACLSAPLLEVRSLPFVWPDSPIDAIAVTSANAITAIADGAAHTRVPLFAVGERTAAAGRACGFEDVRSGGGDAAALIATIVVALPAPARLLYLAGVDRKPALESGLAARGHEIVVREVYEVAPVEALPRPLADALARDAVDAALHYSRRSAAIFCRLTAEGGFGAVVAGLRHHCLSADAAGPLRECGAKWLAIADSPTEDALLTTLPP